MTSWTHLTREQQIAQLEKDWAENPRWKGIKRGYSAADVVKLRGSLQIDHTLAKRGAEKLWNLINTEPFVNTLGALTGNQAMQQVKAGLKGIYLSGWQVAGDANSNGEMYPDQSLYSVDSVPKVVKKINATFARADQIQWSEGKGPGDDGYIDYFAPIVADAEAGFGGVLNAYELMRSMIEAGAAGVHFEDQLASVKKCGTWAVRCWFPRRRQCRSWRPLASPRTWPACRRSSSRAPTPRRLTCSPPTSTTTTNPSSPGSAPPRASTR